MLTRLCDGFRSGLLDALAQISIETVKWDTLQTLGDDVLPNAILRIGQLAIAFAAYPKATKSLIDAMDGIHGRLPVLTKSKPFGELWQTLYDTVIDRTAFREMYETARKLENRSCDQVGARSNALLTISLKRYFSDLLSVCGCVTKGILNAAEGADGSTTVPEFVKRGHG